jgi:uncharacterized protein (TIGR00730 family)
MLLYIASGESNDIPEKYLDDCRDVLDYLLTNNDLLFGACDRGLMGCAYRSALAHGREIVGVCPKIYEGDLANLQCTEKITTDGIVESINLMVEKCDALVVMPGGFGTLYEFFLAMQGIICKEFNKTIVIYNSCGFYDEILGYFQKIAKEGFVKEAVMNSFVVANNLDELKATFGND